MFSVKPMYQHHAEGRDDRRRDRDGRDERRAQVATGTAARRARRRSDAEDEVLLDAVDRRFDELRHDRARCGRRSPAAASASVRPGAPSRASTTSHGVRAGLRADLQQHRAGAVHVGERRRLPPCRLRRARRRARSIGWPSRSRTTMSLKTSDGGDAPARAQRERARALLRCVRRALRRSADCSARDTSVTVRL